MAAHQASNDALDAFRREWLEELQQVDRSVREEETPEQARKRQARELYSMGAHYEREGQIALAIQSYREAFHLDPKLGERRYELPTAPMGAAASADAAASAGPSTAGSLPEIVLAEPEPVEPVVESVPPIPEYLRPASHLHTFLLAGTMPAIEVADPVSQGSSTHLSALPNELLLLVLRHCDVVSVERAGRSCKLLYVLSRDFSVWRERCLATLSRNFCERVLRECDDNWRILYLLAPRVRDDGLYILKQSYFRRGPKRCRAGSIYDSLVEVVYWRYFRFYLDGTLVTASTAEHPASARLTVKRNGKNVRSGEYTQRHREISGYVRDNNAIFQYRLSLAKTTFARVRGESAPKLTVVGYNALNTRTKVVTEFDFANQVYVFVSFERLAKLKAPPPVQDEA